MRGGMDEYLLVTQRDVGGGFMSDRWASLRPLGWASVIAGVLWLGGFGSFFAVGFGLIGIFGRSKVVSPEHPPPGLRMCQVGTALGVLGLLVTAVWLLAD